MENERTDLRREEAEPKTQWQLTKESWYDKVNLTVKQLDLIIGCATAGLILTFIAIVMDVMGVF